jgi:MFS family permease
VGFLLTTVPAPSLLRRAVAPGRLTRMLGVWSTYMPFGTALALLAGPLLIGVLGWRGWWVLTALCTAAMLVWLPQAVPRDVRCGPATCRRALAPPPGHRCARRGPGWRRCALRCTRRSGWPSSAFCPRCTSSRAGAGAGRG